MRTEAAVRKGQIVTAVSLSGAWIRVVQVRLGDLSQRAALLAAKAKKAEGYTEEQASAALKELVRALPSRTEQVVGLISTGQVLSRYFRLPASEPEELRAMARYQLEGLLPFPAQECITTVKVLGAAGEAVQVLAAAVHRPVVERFSRICSNAGLSLSGMATSAEAIENWHQLCLPSLARGEVKVWLSAEIGPEGLDIGIASGGSLIYMRQVPVPTDLEQMTERIKETLRAYAREQVGPPVERMILSGRLENFPTVPLERLEAALDLPVERLDAGEGGPLQGSLQGVLQAVQPELTFSDLLGAALSPRLLELDLLPIENRIERARQALAVSLQRTTALVLLGSMAAAAWVGVRVGTTWWMLRQTRTELAILKPQADRAQALTASIQAIARSRAEYALLMKGMSEALAQAPAGLTLQFLGLDPDRTITVRGLVPDLERLTQYANSLREDSLWEEVLLKSAQVEEAAGGLRQVDFEMVLRPVKGSKE